MLRFVIFLGAYQSNQELQLALYYSYYLNHTKNNNYAECTRYMELHHVVSLT